MFSVADVLLVPLVPSTLSVRTFEQLSTFLADGPEPPPAVVAFLSMVDRRRRLHRELALSLPEALPAVAEAAIPVASAVELMGRSGAARWSAATRAARRRAPTPRCGTRSPR